MIVFKNKKTGVRYAAGTDIQKNYGTTRPNVFYTFTFKHTLSHVDPPILKFKYQNKGTFVWGLEKKNYRYL